MSEEFEKLSQRQALLRELHPSLLCSVRACAAAHQIDAGKQRHLAGFQEEATTAAGLVALGISSGALLFRPARWRELLGLAAASGALGAACSSGAGAAAELAACRAELAGRFHQLDRAAALMLGGPPAPELLERWIGLLRDARRIAERLPPLSRSTWGEAGSAGAADDWPAATAALLGDPGLDLVQLLQRTARRAAYSRP